MSSSIANPNNKLTDINLGNRLTIIPNGYKAIFMFYSGAKKMKLKKQFLKRALDSIQVKMAEIEILTELFRF